MLLVFITAVLPIRVLHAAKPKGAARASLSQDDIVSLMVPDYQAKLAKSKAEMARPPDADPPPSWYVYGADITESAATDLGVSGREFIIVAIDVTDQACSVSCHSVVLGGIEVARRTSIGSFQAIGGVVSSDGPTVALHSGNAARPFTVHFQYQYPVCGALPTCSRWDLDAVVTRDKAGEVRLKFGSPAETVVK